MPANLRNSLRVRWHISDWCNYQCAYCAVPVFIRRNTDGAPRRHSFDRYSPEEWLRAFEKFTRDEIALIVTGGEPFMDRANFPRTLRGLVQRERFIIRTDTNGSWNPDYFSSLDTRVASAIDSRGLRVDLPPLTLRIAG